MALRAGGPKSFHYHLTIQLCGSFLIFLGLGAGLLKSRKINTIHQWVGIMLTSAVVIQGLLGWWHHRAFVRLHRRTWSSYLHIWLGRLVMIAGWSNIVTGLLLRGYTQGSPLVAISIVIICLQGVGLSWWKFWSQREQAKYVPTPSWTKEDDDTFALSITDDEDDQMEEKDERDEIAHLQRQDSRRSIDRN